MVEKKGNWDMMINHPAQCASLIAPYELAGQFADRTCGAYLIKADNLEEAKALAFSDPVHTTKSSIVTVYERNAK